MSWMKFYDSAGPGHWWLENRRCKGCGMSIYWAGAREKCTLRYKPPSHAIEPLGRRRRTIKGLDAAIERAEKETENER